MVGVELALLVALPGLAVTGSLAAAHYSARLVQIGPGLVAVERLQRGVLEQSSGLARYIDHREPGAIAQYASGETTTTQALGQVRTALAGGSRSALLDRVEAAVRGWHAWAERTRLDVAASGGVPDKATTDAGNRLLGCCRSG